MTVGEIIRRQEDDYIHGTTHKSKYVDYSMHDTLERIEAYLSSKHISGETDSLDREKPFFNISVAAANVWFRATDIDRKNFQIFSPQSKNWLDSMMATFVVRDWMRRENFGSFLNEWGRVLSRYGSAVPKFVETDDSLHISVVPWNQLIVDQVDFDSNPVIEVIELTEAQLYERISTHGYDAEQVRALCEAAQTARETLDKQKKDNKTGYIKLYELHANLTKDKLTGKESDEETYVRQMHVMSFVGVKNGRKTEYQDFTLYAGEEENSPYMITHLIREDGQTLAIGAVQHMFEPQWMVNHSMKAIKDTLDLSSKLIFQTADARFVGRNVLQDMMDGDILHHLPNMPLTQVSNAKPDVTQWQTYALAWKQVGNEMVGVSEAMLGAQPKAGTAWRLQEAILQENYSLFELMTENKALYLEQMFRERVIPYLKRTQLNNADEVAAILEAHEINQIDPLYIKSEAVKRYNERTVKQVFDMAEALAAGKMPTDMPQPFDPMMEEAVVKSGMAPFGNRRYLKPSEVDWKTQFKDLEWEVIIDISGEEYDTKDALTTLNTALQMVVTPGFEQNPRAQALVARVLELTGAMSPLEYNSIPKSEPASIPTPTPTPAPPTPVGPGAALNQ